MGLISSNICSYDREEESDENNSKNKSLSARLSINDNSQDSIDIKRKVKFSNTINIREFEDNEDNDIDNQEYKKEFNTKSFFKNNSSFDIKYLRENDNNSVKDSEIPISFDEINKFVIEDNYHKFYYKLPMFNNIIENFNNDEETSAESMDDEKMKSFSKSLQEVIRFCKENDMKRIDGIIYKSRKLLILTESHIIEFELIEDKFILIKSVNIFMIDYITKTNDNECILHIVQNYNNMQNFLHYSFNNYISNDILKFENKDNYIIRSKYIEEIISCIAGSFLLRKTYDSRLLSVININKNFEIYNELKKIKDYRKYSDILNSFLVEKLKTILLKIKKFKYCAVHYNTSTLKGKKDFRDVDMIITNELILILQYKNKCFEIIKKLYLQNIINVKMKPRTFTFIFNNVDKSSLEIKTKSYSCLSKFITDLINDLKKDYTKK